MSSYTQRTGEWVVIAQQAFEAQQKRRYFEKLEKKLFNDLGSRSHGKASIGGGLVFFKKEDDKTWILEPESKHLPQIAKDAKDLQLISRINSLIWSNDTQKKEI
jgi:hypothetical protein